MVPIRRAGPLAAGALAEGARARCVACHRSARFLRLDDGRLVALLPVGAPLHPWAMSASFDRVALVQGTVAAADPGAEPWDGVRLALDSAEVPALRLRVRPAALAPGAVRRLAERLAAHVAAAPPDPRWAAVLTPPPGDAALATMAARIGLGPGLTPAADDLVLGALAALDLARDAVPPAAARAAALTRALDGDLDARTTRLSAQLLRAALAGLHAEPVLEVLDALAARSDPSGRLEAAADALFAVGHQSGRHTLQGMVSTLESLLAA